MMKQFNYIFSAVGWLGFAITLILLIILDKSGNGTSTIQKETIINNYYDSATRLVNQKTVLPGEPIFIPVPADVDTDKIIAGYFSKYPFSRTFEDTAIRVTLLDTICQNRFMSPGKFSYKYLQPVRTVESTTITNEAPKKMSLLIGLHANFNQKTFTDIGPDVYLKTKRDQLIGVGYDIGGKEVSFKTAFNLYEVFRNKNK